MVRESIWELESGGIRYYSSVRDCGGEPMFIYIFQKHMTNFSNIKSITLNISGTSGLKSWSFLLILTKKRTGQYAFK